jgi:hypothetical protein
VKRADGVDGLVAHVGKVCGGDDREPKVHQFFAEAVDHEQRELVAEGHVFLAAGGAAGEEPVFPGCQLDGNGPGQIGQGDLAIACGEIHVGGRVSRVRLIGGHGGTPILSP